MSSVQLALRLAALLIGVSTAQVAGAPLKLPATKGIAGGWQIDFTGNVSGARHIHPINTDKDGSIVASRVASALAGIGVPSISDTREIYITPKRYADASYVDEAADYIVNQLYGTLGQAGSSNPLLRKTTLVFTSVHRYGLYVAEALHAIVLPLQFISFASSWAQVVNASRAASVIVGQDFDHGGLWLWNKIAAGKTGTRAGNLPPAYWQALQQATNVIIVQPCDNWVYCDPVADPNGYNCWDAINETYTGGSSGTIYMHTSLTRSGTGQGGQLYQAAKAAGLVGKAAAADVKNLKQWEWGVPDTAVANIQKLWTGTLRRSLSNFKVISGGVVDMFAWTPDLWRTYLQTNGLKPRGFHWNSYWVAHTALERAAAVLPFPSYSYYQPDWHPLDDKARSVVAGVLAASGGATASSFAANSRVFANNIGSAGDTEAIKRLLTEYGMGPTAGLAFYGVGFDCTNAAAWTGWNGTTTVPYGFVAAASALLNTTRSPYRTRSWIPMSFANFSSLPSVCNAWTQF